MSEGEYGLHETASKASMPIMLADAFLLITSIFYVYERV